MEGGKKGGMMLIWDFLKMMCLPLHRKLCSYTERITLWDFIYCLLMIQGWWAERDRCPWHCQEYSVAWSWMLLESKWPIPQVWAQASCSPRGLSWVLRSLQCVLTRTHTRWVWICFPVLHFSDFQGWTLRETAYCYVNIDNSIA